MSFLSPIVNDLLSLVPGSKNSRGSSRIGNRRNPFGRPSEQPTYGGKGLGTVPRYPTYGQTEPYPYMPTTMPTTIPNSPYGDLPYEDYNNYNMPFTTNRVPMYDKRIEMWNSFMGPTCSSCK